MNKKNILLENRFLDFLVQSGKILHSSGDVILKINRLLIMLAEFFEIRNAMLLMRDTVTNKYNLELSPELSEEEQKQANFMFDRTLTRYPQKFSYPMMLYPSEISELPLLLPKGLKGNFNAFVSVPLMGMERNVPLGVLFFFITQGERLQDQIKLLNIFSEMISLSMEVHGIHAPKIIEMPQQDFPMIMNGVVGESELLHRVSEMIAKISSSRAAVLVRGESGTGKELIAKAIHKNSLRSSGPFVGVNCAALTDSLLSSELFGHEKGAFTGAVTAKQGRFELADGGTLFLDEIGDTSLNFQAKLLRVLQESEFERLGGIKTIKVDVRIICATNVDLESAIQEGTFREDLFYRLNVVPIDLPALRERKEDIPLLVNYFLSKLNEEYGKAIVVSKEDMALMQNLDWPGNVRELENVVHRGFLMAHEGILRIRPIIAQQKGVKNKVVSAKIRMKGKETKNDDFVPKAIIKEEEIELIERALADAKGIQVEAAQRLGISVRQLRYRIKKYNLMVRKIQY